MDKAIIEFGKRMNQAEDKVLLVDYAEGAKQVLDLGAGTGKISRDIAEKWGAHVDAVDLEFKDNCQNTSNITYYSMDIANFLAVTDKKYDCIVLSAILHELSDGYIGTLLSKLQEVMAPECRILIREPFCDDALGPVLSKDLAKYVELVKNRLPAGKAIEFAMTKKLHNERPLDITDMIGIDWINLSFTISYGEAS